MEEVEVEVAVVEVNWETDENAGVNKAGLVFGTDDNADVAAAVDAELCLTGS